METSNEKDCIESWIKFCKNHPEYSSYNTNEECTTCELNHMSSIEYMKLIQKMIDEQNGMISDLAKKVKYLHELLEDCKPYIKSEELIKKIDEVLK